MKKLISLVLLFPCTALAATMIETNDGKDGQSRIYIKGDKMRMEMPKRQGYMIMDTSNKTMKTVLPEQKTVMDMSDLMKGDASATNSNVKVTTKNKGKGPKIAGYDTTEYSLQANGKNCGSMFVSAKVMNDLELSKFASAMQNFSNQIQNRLSSFSAIAGQQKPCQQAQHSSVEHMKTIGFPLRVTDANKRLMSEVTRITRNAKLPANAFSVPSDYQVTNPNKMIQDAMKQMPPDAMEMMRKRMQQMYQQ